MIQVKDCMLLFLLTTSLHGISVAVEIKLEDSNDSSSLLVTNREHTTPISFEIPYVNNSIYCTSFGSPTAPLSLIFTQGAIGNLSSPSVANFLEGFSELKKIIYFQGRANLQTRTEMFKTVTEHHHCNVIGGRSMGSRVAITTAKEIDDVQALILVSFPLRNRDEVRSQLLLDIDEGTDVLLVIGSRDRKCNLNELRTLTKEMKAKAWIVVVNGANHKMEMRPSKATRAVGKMVGRVVAKWIEERNDTLTDCHIHWDEEQNDAVLGHWSNGLGV